jgi:hypothetical protein
MTRIKELKKVLSEIERAPISVGCGELKKIMQKAKTPMPEAGMDSIKDKCIKSLHTTIQTEMMIKSCIFAKWSCLWAAIAATLSFVSLLVICFLR